MTEHFGGLAATGSDVTPWLIVAGIIVLLGVIALIIAGAVRSRRAERQVEDAAEAVADAGGTLPEPDPEASGSAETVIEEASELGTTDARTAPPAPPASPSPLESPAPGSPAPGSPTPGGPADDGEGPSSDSSPRP
ncbi:LPXTG cell wall anchor domain-containing protein [Humibacter ginsengisoli]